MCYFHTFSSFDFGFVWQPPYFCTFPGYNTQVNIIETCREFVLCTPRHHPTPPARRVMYQRSWSHLVVIACAWFFALHYKAIAKMNEVRISFLLSAHVIWSRPWQIWGMSLRLVQNLQEEFNFRIFSPCWRNLSPVGICMLVVWSLWIQVFDLPPNTIYLVGKNPENERSETDSLMSLCESGLDVANNGWCGYFSGQFMNCK